MNDKIKDADPENLEMLYLACKWIFLLWEKPLRPIRANIMNQLSNTYTPGVLERLFEVPLVFDRCMLLQSIYLYIDIAIDKVKNPENFNLHSPFKSLHSPIQYKSSLDSIPLNQFDWGQ